MAKKIKSIVYKSAYPDMYIPVELQSPMALKRFWYIPIFEFGFKAWYYISTPWRWLMAKLEKDATATMEQLENSQGEEIKIDAPDNVEIKMEIPNE